MNWGWRFSNGFGMWGLFGLLAMVVLLAALVWLVVLVLRGPRHAPPPGQPWQPPYTAPTPRPTPHEILRERLARGDITVDEYQRVLAALGPDTASPPPGPQGPQPPPSF